VPVTGGVKNIPQETRIRMRDGVELGAALHVPPGGGKFPSLVAISPYRYDNDIVPEGPLFLWRETGPVEFYMSHGYAYVRVDVRGTGRSGGNYGFFDKAEQQDYFDVVEWIAQQPWCSGKVGGIGQSYYAMSQWFMAAQQPPSLACIAPYDGLTDLYRSVSFPGGIEGEFWPMWWNLVRSINLHPANGAAPHEILYDLPLELKRHPTIDSYWHERTVNLDRIQVPVFSIGLWAKVDLHLTGNIEGYQSVKGPKKLLITGAANVFAAAADFSKIETHERLLLPFYERYLKENPSAHDQRANVEYFVRGPNQYKSADQWPPAGVRYEKLYLRKGPTGSVTSLNDGALSREASAEEESTSYAYPDSGWVLGVVGFGPNGAPDPARRVLTFTSPPLTEDVEIAGPMKLSLFLSSTCRDTDVFVKVSEQLAAPADAATNANPASQIVSKGWLKASHRVPDKARSRDYEPVYQHARPEPIEPGKTVQLDIAIRPAAYVFRKGSRIRLEIANGDSPITDTIFTHMYLPNKLGEDTIHHGAKTPSTLFLPVVSGRL
jgi:putative CocE/NonD family hydrolase